MLFRGPSKWCQKPTFALPQDKKSLRTPKVTCMSLTAEQLNELIKQRRAVYPQFYNDKPIARKIIEQILENARWAPTHKLTQPWRFKVLTGKALERLSEYLGEYYRKNTPPEEFSQKKLNKVIQKPLKSACVIAIGMMPDPQKRVPEWEELAAVACAVENMWLSCTAYGIGCYWSSPKSILEASEFLGLAEGEKCLGLLYMGYYDTPLPPTPRDPIETKTTWISE